MILKEQRNIYTKKIQQFINRLERRILSEYRPLDAQRATSVDPVPFAKRLDLDYSAIEEGAQWGKTWESAWFHLTGSVPDEWKGKEVVANLDFNGEGLVFSQEGVPLQGLTNGSVFGTAYRHTFLLQESAKGGESVDLWVETAANGLFGWHVRGCSHHRTDDGAGALRRVLRSHRRDFSGHRGLRFTNRRHVVRVRLLKHLPHAPIPETPPQTDWAARPPRSASSP